MRFLLAFAALLSSGFAQAQEADEPHDLLIRNATLMDPGGTAPDCMVSLLDTKTYASFAIRDGRVVKNTLVQVPEPEQDVQPREQRY